MGIPGSSCEGGSAGSRGLGFRSRGLRVSLGFRGLGFLVPCWGHINNDHF